MPTFTPAATPDATAATATATATAVAVFPASPPGAYPPPPKLLLLTTAFEVVAAEFPAFDAALIAMCWTMAALENQDHNENLCETRHVQYTPVR